MKDVIVSVETSKDSDADSSKPSSKATSLQNSPAIQKGQTPNAVSQHSSLLLFMIPLFYSSEFSMSPDISYNQLAPFIHSDMKLPQLVRIYAQLSTISFSV